MGGNGLTGCGNGSGRFGIGGVGRVGSGIGVGRFGFVAVDVIAVPTLPPAIDFPGPISGFDPYHL
jgi:hypothetical protein